MLFRSFAHWLLVLFSLIVLATLVVLAAEFGVMGETARSLIDAIWHAFQEFYEPRSSVLDPAVKWIGLVGSALAAAWTVHKGWHYAERSLPARLEELNARWKDATVRGRPEVVPALNQIVSIAPPAAVRQNLVSRFILWLLNSEQAALLRCSQNLDRREAELRVLTSSRDRCRAEVTTTYLELGAQLARCAPDSKQGVLNLFKKPLEFDSKDLDALELSAKQAFALSFEQPAFNYLSELTVAAADAKDQVRSARASRFQAELLLRRGSQTALADARAKLVSNTSLLANLDGCDPLRRNVELALTHERLAEVQIVREKFSAAETTIGDARRLFGTLPRQWAPDGLERLKKLEEKLTRAKKDKDNADVPD